MLNFPKCLGFQQLERQILELPFEPSDTKTIGEGGIDLAGLPSNPLALFFLQGTNGAHVVDPIRQLHQHNPNVTGHRHKHPAQIFGLCLGAVVEMNATKLGDPLHQLTHFRAEMLLDLLERYIGVFHHIVEEARRDHWSTRSDITQ